MDDGQPNAPKAALPDPAAHAEHLDTLEPRVAEVLRFILRVAGGDFTARGQVSHRTDEIDAIVVGLNMLAESFERERLLRDRAEALLADALDSYENAPGLFCSVGAESLHIVKCNQTFADAVGLSKAMLEGRSILELCVPSSRAELQRALQAIASGEKQAARPAEVELTRTPQRVASQASASQVSLPQASQPQASMPIVQKPAPLTVSITGSVMYDAYQEPLRLRLALRDVTVERQLESQLLHAQKMDAIGQLAGGVAHDFNNLLMVIQSAGTLLSRQVAPASSQGTLLGQIQDACNRAATLTRQLLTFARPESSRPSTVDVAALILRDEAMLQRLLGSRIKLDVRIDSYECLVRIDSARLEQALMNLVINARDAMPGGGTLAIALDQSAFDRPLATAPRSIAEKHVRLSVIDTGVGIAPEIQSRIFEPFFSTKPPGSGTGLGLAMVYGIVSQAGGETHVSSKPGHGARFDLYFPQVVLEPTKSHAAQAQLEARGGDEQVLVVEDDPDVRALTVMILQDGGYDVHEAQSAEHALALSPALLDTIDLVVSDVIMPGLPGPELVKAMIAQRPKLRSVLVSGYPADHRVGDRWFLPKPFGPSQLLRIVRERLDAKD